MGLKLQSLGLDMIMGALNFGEWIIKSWWVIAAVTIKQIQKEHIYNMSTLKYVATQILWIDQPPKNDAADTKLVCQ